MSRVGSLPINLPKGTEVIVEKNKVVVKGSKGELSLNIDLSFVNIKIEEDICVVSRLDDQKFSRSIHGTIRSLINNMVKGVSDGFERKLQIVGVGYKVEKKGSDLQFSLGYSHPILVKKIDNVEFDLDPSDKNAFFVRGIDKQVLGQVVANIKSLRRMDPYKGKGIRDFGQVIKLKPGKTAK